MQDRLPAEKLAEIAAKLAEGDESILPRGRWWLSDEEIAEFGAVGVLLERREVEPAMKRFKALTSRRAVRLVDEVISMLPSVRPFASDADVPLVDARVCPQLAGPLGVAVPERPQTLATLADQRAQIGDPRVERILRHGDDYGCGPGVRRLVGRALALRLQVRGYKFAVSVTPPKRRDLTLITLTPRSERDGRVTVWVADPGTFAGTIPGISVDRVRELLPRLASVPLSEAGPPRS